MGSFPGTCEIVESKEELDSVQHSKRSIQQYFGSAADEIVGKLPMLKTRRNCSVEDDLNQIFEAIDRRTSARSLGLSQKSGAGAPSKNASKKPIRVGISQASGIGISESVSLKQALRGLCISHASEMAAMKRLSKPVGSPGISEAGAAKRLYRTVVVEASESGLPLDDGKGSMVEISLVPESSASDPCQNISESVQVSRENSSNPSGHSSPRFDVATTTKASKVKTQPQEEIVLESPEVEGKTQMLKFMKKNLRHSSPASCSNTIKKVLEQDEIVPAFSEDGNKASKLKLVEKGELCSIPSFSNPKTVNKLCKSASNSPRAVKPIVSSATIKKLAAVGRQPRDEIIPESNEAGGKTSALMRGQKEKVKSLLGLSISNTIKKVLEVDEPDPVLVEVGSKKSVMGPSQKGQHYSLPSLFGSNISVKVSRSASNSPQAAKQVVRHKSFRKKIQQACDEVDNVDLVPGTNSMVCITPNCNQKNVKKESASPSSSNTSPSIEVSSSSMEYGARNQRFSSNSCNSRVLGVKASAKSKSRVKGEFSQSSKSSIGEYSSSTSISDESNLSGSSCGGSRPHMSKDLRWDAIRHVEMRSGNLGLRNFKLLKRLGCGDIGTVYLAELIGTGCLFALKVMDNEFLASRKKMPRAQTEREILQMLDHPFLPTLYSHFTTEKFSCLVMEYCPGGDLHVLRQKQPNRCFSEEAARFYVAEVLLALEYLHMLGVVYRDLKPENILVREDGHIMVSDFDLSLRCSVSPTLIKSSSSIVEPAKKLSGPCAESSCIDPFCLQPSWAQVSCFSPRLMSTPAKPRKPKSELAAQVSPLPQLVAEPTSARSNSFVGTHEYLAPEIVKGEGHGSAVDWWTFGIFLYELLYGKTPFKGSGNEDTLANVVLHSLKFPEGHIVSFQARDLIRGLLIKEPENRTGSVRGAAEIKQHQFFEGLNWALIRCAIPPELPKFHDPGIAAVPPPEGYQDPGVQGHWGASGV